MYRLARIRAAGVGPPDARFDRPSPDAAPFEVSCVGASGTPDDSVIWLENGGGKTVFLALLFHVLRPDKASQIGNDEKGRRADIADFVLTGDVAHVACEWEATDGAVRLITGLVADRRGSQTPRTWYLLAIRDNAASLDDLEFDIDGRRIPHARYVESLDQLAARAGKSGRQNRIVFTKATTQRQWLDLLADHDLDPALFEYQVRMNRSEGGATSLFRFTSDERFVEFFLQLTLNPESVTALSEELSRVAEKVSSLPRKELELAHVSGAAERLDKLASTWTTFDEADQSRDAAQRHAEDLHDRLTAAVGLADDSVRSADNEVRDAEAALSDMQRARRENETRTRIVAISLAEARIGLLEDEVTESEAVATDTALTTDTWARVPQLLRRTALIGEIRETRSALEDADVDAAPLRERRDNLLRGLRLAIVQQEATAQDIYDSAESTRIEAESAEGAAESTHDEEAGQARELDGRIVEIERQLGAHTNALQRAVAAGHLTAGAAPDTALKVANAEIETLTIELRNVGRERDDLDRELEPARERRLRAGETLARADADHRLQAAQVERATAARNELSTDRLLAVVGYEGADLELVGAELAARVSNEADHLRVAAVAAAAATAEDQRAADTLERDRLLPARAEVKDLCRLLIDAGVRLAVPGWRYLVSSVPSAMHKDVISRHPALLDGIVVPAAEIDRAQQLLEGAAPGAAVVVGAGATFEENDIRADGWVIPPAPAMHDMSAAEAELERRRSRIETAADAAAQIRRDETKARQLANDLTVHLEEWPPGRLPAATALRDELEAAAMAARVAADEAREEVKSIEQWIRDLDSRKNHVGAKVTAAQTLVSRLGPLVASAAAAAESEATLIGLRTDRDRHGRAAATALAERNAARLSVQAAIGRRNTAESAINGSRQLLASLPDVDDGHAEPGTLTELRSAYDAAVLLVAAATTDSELARRLSTLEGERAEIDEEFLVLSADMMKRLTELASRPEAVDPTARRRANEEARRLSTEAAKAHAYVMSNLSVAHRNRESLQDPEPSWRVEPFEIPDAIADLETYLADLEAEGERTRAARSEADERVNEARRALTGAQQHRDALEGQRTALSHAVGERTSLMAEPFTGNAVAAVADALGAVKRAAESREQADSRWRTAAATLGRWARDSKWTDLTGELARRLRDDDPELLARDAASILLQAQILHSRLDDDISKLDVHRQMLVTSLGDAVNEAARSLRSARRKSELPAGLGDWSQQPFIKIVCDIAKDRTDLDARLRRFTNDLLERAPSVGLPTGADLVCRALLACTERDVTVEVLKPNKAQRLRYVPITELATLSGGMRATAAIAMFCTLAKVRAANRSGRVGVGTLVLDNPLGDANATYLVALQRLVAQASDVQLVYTTGVNDMDALRMFPVVTRLTNEAAKRSHLAYVVGDEGFLKRLAPSEGDNAIVTGARLVRRTQPLLAVDLAHLAGEDDE